LANPVSGACAQVPPASATSPSTIMRDIVGLSEMPEHRNFLRVWKSKVISQVCRDATMAARIALWNNVFSNTGIEAISI
jgi:hypothetical protein